MEIHRHDVIIVGAGGAKGYSLTSGSATPTTPSGRPHGTTPARLSTLA
jgi:hypothetical protein